MQTSSLDKIKGRFKTDYADDNLSIIDQIADLSKIPPMTRVDVYAVALLTRGKAAFFVDGELHEMQENQLFFFRPHITLERTTLTADAQYQIILISPQYTQTLISMSGRYGWNIIMYLDTNPTIQLTPTQVEDFSLYIKLIKSKLADPNAMHHREVLDALFSAMLYEFHELMQIGSQQNPPSFTTAQTIFYQFNVILHNTKVKHRKLEYYADQLNISAKHLSTICKRVTGKTALQHISDAIIQDILLLLRNEKLSIKDVARITGFPNQSFLGAYVKKHIGISPQRYRDESLRAKYNA